MLHTQIYTNLITQVPYTCTNSLEFDIISIPSCFRKPCQNSWRERLIKYGTTKYQICNIHTYIHTTYIHTYILHTYIHTYINTYIHYVHTYINTVLSLKKHVPALLSRTQIYKITLCQRCVIMITNAINRL